VVFPAGEYLIGSPPNEADAQVNEPRHPVKLTRPIAVSDREITWQQFNSFDDHGHHDSLEEQFGRTLTANEPVFGVSWYEAVGYCRWLTKSAGMAEDDQAYGDPASFDRARFAADPDPFADGAPRNWPVNLEKHGFRLPTEAEWEMVCRGGTKTAFSFGNDARLLGRYDWFQENSEKWSHPVGQLRPNPRGLFDVHGNLSEWCHDWTGDYAAESESEDPMGPPKASTRISRGGNWFYHAGYGRSATRTSTVPTVLSFSLGFRVAVIPFNQDDALVAQGQAPEAMITAPFDADQAIAIQEASAEHLGSNVEISNSIGMKLRVIPPCRFKMGSPQVEHDQAWQRFYSSECPRHGVQLTRAFCLGNCEVTQQQFQEVMGVNPSWFSLTGEGKDAVQGMDTRWHPVDNVSWFDAVDFCNKLSEREQRSPYYVREGETVKVLGGTGYRLPTEAEWEFACRAGSTTLWAFGNNEPDLPHHAWLDSNAGNRTHRVGDLLPNPFGLHDLYGNVWEWCWDWYDYYSAMAVKDPTGAPAGAFTAGNTRVMRGGGFSSGPLYARSANRYGYSPRGKGNNLGFRVARTLP
jgi:formylglycine-generating enzyme required for sulfatase activity